MHPLHSSRDQIARRRQSRSSFLLRCGRTPTPTFLGETRRAWPVPSILPGRSQPDWSRRPARLQTHPRSFSTSMTPPQWGCPVSHISSSPTALATTSWPKWRTCSCLWCTVGSRRSTASSRCPTARRRLVRGREMDRDREREREGGGEIGRGERERERVASYQS